MPVAGKLFYRKLKLPGYPEEDPAYVTICTNPKAGILEGLDGIEDKQKRAMIMISKMITEWNFTDDAGQVLPITPENCEKSLSLMDIDAIESELNLRPNTLPDAKKKS